MTSRPASRLRSTPLICLVSDRRRLATLGADPAEATVIQAMTAARAGADLIQIREPDLDGGPLLALVARCVAAVRGTAARVIVNERLDVAVAAGAHGAHLRASSFGATRARTLVPREFVIGRSVHGAAEARAAVEEGGVDYLIAGPVFPTTSKAPGHPVLGLEAFERLARGSEVPVLAIGGITAARAPSVMAAGAAGLAAIGQFLPEPGGDPGEAAARAVWAVRAALRSAGAAQNGKLGGDQA